MRCLVARRESAALGPAHPDTAAAAHNLGCALSRLGRGDRALPLLDGAHAALAAALGHGHPRTQLAARNAERVRRAGGGGGNERAAAHSYSDSDGDGGVGCSQTGGGGGSSRDGARERRLAAIDARLRGGGDDDKGCGRRQPQGRRGRQPEYTDADHLGGGVFRASPELRRRYNACRAAVERRRPPAADSGSGGGASSGSTVTAAAAAGGAVLRRGRLDDATVLPAAQQAASAAARIEARRAAGRKAGPYTVTGTRAAQQPAAGALLLGSLVRSSGGMNGN